MCDRTYHAFNGSVGCVPLLPGRQRSGLSTQTVVAALRLDGLTAPAVFDGPIDKTTFFGYVEQVLVPMLRAGDVVVLDNLAVHKQPAVHCGDRVSTGLRKML